MALFCAFALMEPAILEGQAGPVPARTPLQGNVVGDDDDPAHNDPSQLASDIYHELAITLGTPPRPHERLENDFARFDRQVSRGNARAIQLQPCVEKMRQAKPHAYRAAELFSQPVERNREAKIGGDLLTAGAVCMEQPSARPVPPTSDFPGGPPRLIVSPIVPPGRGPGGGPAPPPGPPAGEGPGPGPAPAPRTWPGSTPCRPYGPGGYDYCNNPEGTRLPPGCVCGGPGIPPPTRPATCENVPPVEEQAALRRTGIELLDTLAGGGQQTSIFLEHASRATLAGIAQILHPAETVQGWAGGIAGAVDFLGNQDPSKWVRLRDGAAAALNDARRSPAGFLGDQAGAYIAGNIGRTLTAVRACRLDPPAARALSDKAAKTQRAAKTATRLNRNAAVPGNQPPCGFMRKKDCFWRAMRDATGDPAFDKLLDGPGVPSWGDVYKNLAKYFAGKVPGVDDPAGHVLGIPGERQLDEIMKNDLAQRGSEGLVFVRLRNGQNHVLMGANLTGTPALFDDQKQFWSGGRGSMTVEQALGDLPVAWKFYRTR